MTDEIRDSFFAEGILLSCFFKTMILFSLLFTVPSFSQTKSPSVIYDSDDRREVLAPDVSQFSQASKSVALVVEQAHLNKEKNRYQVLTQPYQQAYKVCSDEKYSDQPLAGFCTAFLVAPDLLLTAGHCISNRYECGESAFLFDYIKDSSGKIKTEFDESEVAFCKELISYKKDFIDYALIRLEKPMARSVLPLTNHPMVENTKNLTLIGHPLGLPMKVSPGAAVRTVKEGVFIVNTDSYGGNSGSPVLNEKQQVVGILVRGEKDFVYDDDKGCNRSKVVNGDEGRGEDVTDVYFLRKIVESVK